MRRTFKSNIITNGSIKKDPNLFGKYSKFTGSIHEKTDDNENVLQNDRKKKEESQRHRHHSRGGGGMKWARNISNN